MDCMGIVLFEYLSTEKEKIEKHGIGNQFCNLEESLVL